GQDLLLAPPGSADQRRDGRRRAPRRLRPYEHHHVASLAPARLRRGRPVRRRDRLRRLSGGAAYACGVGRALDIAYALALPAFLPALLRKRRSGVRARFGHVQEPLPSSDRPRLLVHAVSVGEVNLVAPLVRTLTREHGVEVIVSTTTDTGFDRARALYADSTRVVRYPVDFTRCVRRFLDAVRPDAVALVELELWPNVAAECVDRGVPLAVVNGRLSARSFGGY